jgi:hypothetical protein
LIPPFPHARLQQQKEALLRLFYVSGLQLTARRVLLFLGLALFFERQLGRSFGFPPALVSFAFVTHVVPPDRLEIDNLYYERLDFIGAWLPYLLD